MWSLQINYWNKNTILDSVFILNKLSVFALLAHFRFLCGYSEIHAPKPIGPGPLYFENIGPDRDEQSFENLGSNRIGPGPRKSRTGTGPTNCSSYT